VPQCKAVVIAWLCVLAAVARADANEYLVLSLHHRVAMSDLIVVGRVVDPKRALVRVERVVKGKAPSEITLTAYIDGWLDATDQRPLRQDARELMFLQEKGASYAPLQTQHGRFPADRNRLALWTTDPGPTLSTVIASIRRLMALQARAARSVSEADQAYVEALQSADPEVRTWAFETGDERITAPSPALTAAFLARWPTDAFDVANAIITWRIRSAAPIVAGRLTSSNDGNERAAAAVALGGTGDVAYLPLLRRAASSDGDPFVRAEAYSGIVSMIGPDALPDLRLGAKDSSEKVRAQVTSEAFNMLELGWEQPRFPRPSAALIDEVVALLQGMQNDSATRVSQSAKTVLAAIARLR
jgi:HEAT repeat protein